MIQTCTHTNTNKNTQSKHTNENTHKSFEFAMKCLQKIKKTKKLKMIV